MSERYIVALEIGSSKLRGAVGRCDESGMLDVLAVEEEKLTGSVRYGCITNVEVSNALSRICERLESYPQMDQRNITGLYIGLGGRSMISGIKEVEASLPAEMEITPAIIADLRNQASKLVDTDLDVAEVVPVKFTVDGKAQTNPVGSYGSSVGAKMCVVTCNPVMKRMTRRVIYERLGLEIVGYVTRPLAEGAVALAEDERRLGCMLVDCGAETTTVVIYKNGTPIYLATLPLGSRNITLDITTLNHTEERAEEIKRVSGNVMAAETAGRTGADGIDYTEVNHYVHARAAEIITNILAQLEYAGIKSADLPGGIVLVGGGSRLKGFSELLARQSKMKVRIGAPQAGIRISDGAITPAENIDVIAILAEAAKRPEAVCVSEPVVPEPEPLPETGDDTPDDDDDDEPRIGRLDDDDEFAPKKEDNNKKKPIGPTPGRSKGLFSALKSRLAGLLDEGEEM